MHRPYSKCSRENNEAKVGVGNVRVTRSRAKAIGVSIVSPLKHGFKRERVSRPSNKRIAPDDAIFCSPSVTYYKPKRREVLKDVSNILAKNICTERNVKATSKRGRKDSKQITKHAANIAMEISVDMDVVKSKLAEGLSKIRMVETIDVSDPNYNDGEVTEQKEDGSNARDCLQVVDIDSNVQDPKLCSCYAASIYDNIHVLELEQRPSISYMIQVQKDIDPTMRGILIDWLVEVSDEYKLASDTLYLTVNLIDRFLSHNYIEKPRLQLLGITCMLIASKYEEICAPRLEEFCFITDNTYTKLEVLSMETEVLNFLNFRLSVPTTKTFLRRFIQAAQASDKVLKTQVQNNEMGLLATYLAELTLVDYTFLRFLPSLIAASAVFLARWTLDQSNHPWNPTLQHYTRYNVSDLKTVVLAIEDLQLNISGSTLIAIRSKYNQEKFKRVSTLKSPGRVTTLFSR